MTTHTEIKETVSENRPKRGRPKNITRIMADLRGGAGHTSPNIHSSRGKMNAGYAMEFIGAWARADSEKQMRIMNCTFDDVRAGNHSFPRGFNTAATEIGRWIVTHADTAEAEASSLVIVADARTRGIPWREIRAHFRALRIGPRQGNALSLFRHLATAFDDYCRMFPETTQLARMAGIQNLMDAILPENQP